MIKFPVKLTESEIEKTLKEIIENPNLPLHLPLNDKHAQFGGLSLAIQTINTWSRLGEEKTLLLSSGDRTSDEVADSVIERPFKVAAAMMAKEIKLERDNSNLKSTTFQKIKEMVEQQATNNYGIQRGGLCSFIFIDHSTKGFDRNFYIDTTGLPEPRQIKQFENVIKSMIMKSLSASGGVSLTPSNDEISDIGRIFYELFINTHEHGSRGKLKNKWIKPGNRVIYTNAINLSNTAVEYIKKENPPLAEHINSFDRNNQQHQFIELSIVDSGLGYVGRWLSDHSEKESESDIPIEFEHDIFRKCFKFRSSSSHKDYKGMGLPVVMDRLTNLKGFMKIRSGRMSVYRDFKNKPYQMGDRCAFFDFKTQKDCSETLTEHPKAEGVSITILIPLEGMK